MNFLGIPRISSDRSMNFLGIPRISSDRFMNFSRNSWDFSDNLMGLL